MRYEHDDGCPSPDEIEAYRSSGRKYLLVLAAMLLVMVLAGFLGWLDAKSAVTTTVHRSYALRTCSTCREISFPSEAECTAAAQAEAARVGATRTTGSATYTCIIRHNVIATFKVSAAGEANLSWEHDGLNVDGFRVVYGTRADQLIHPVQIPKTQGCTPLLEGTRIGCRHRLANLAPATYHFAVIAYGGGNDSPQSNIVSKVVM